MIVIINAKKKKCVLGLFCRVVKIENRLLAKLPVNNLLEGPKKCCIVFGEMVQWFY